jgi:hypothetical protein
MYHGSDLLFSDMADTAQFLRRLTWALLVAGRNTSIGKRCGPPVSYFIVVAAAQGIVLCSLDMAEK